MTSRCFALACILFLSQASCIRHQTPLMPRPEAKELYKKEKPASIEPYLRSVFKTSVENHAAQRGKDSKPAPVDPEVALARSQVEHSPSDPEAGKRLASLLFARGSNLEALDQVQSLYQRAPDDPEIVLLLARLWHRLRHLPSAVEAANEVIRLAPESPGGWLALGEAELARGRKPSAAAAYREAIRLGANEIEDFKTCAQLFLEVEWWSEARDCLVGAAGSEPASRELIDGLALAGFHLDGEEAALQTLMGHYSPADAWTRMGKLWLAEKAWPKARDALVQALTLQPSLAEARLLLQKADSYLPPPPVATLPSFASARARVELPWSRSNEVQALPETRRSHVAPMPGRWALPIMLAEPLTLAPLQTGEQAVAESLPQVDSLRRASGLLQTLARAAEWDLGVPGGKPLSVLPLKAVFEQMDLTELSPVMSRPIESSASPWVGGAEKLKPRGLAYLTLLSGRSSSSAVADATNGRTLRGSRVNSRGLGWTLRSGQSPPRPDFRGMAAVELGLLVTGISGVLLGLFSWVERRPVSH